MIILLSFSFFVYTIVPLLLLKKSENIYFKDIVLRIMMYTIGALYLNRYINERYITEDIANKFSTILILGNIIYVFFICISYNSFSIKSNYKIEKYSKMIDVEAVSKVAALFVFIGYIMFIYAIYKMGFVPILSESADAKYMTGIYRDAYLPVAKYYRIGLILVPQFTVIYTFLNIGKKSDFKILMINILSICILIASNRRGMIGGILVEYIFAYMLINKRKKVKYFMLLIMNMIYLAGILYNPVMMYIRYGTSINMYNILMYSIPDMFDNFIFFNNVEILEKFSYGRTVYGGLIPYKYEWNPANYSLIIIAGNSDVSSGGIRFLPAIYGYSFFGSIIFALLYMAFNAMVSGFMLRLNSFVVCESDMRVKLNKYVIFKYGYLIVSSLFSLNIDLMVSVVLFAFIVFIAKIKIKKKPQYVYR